MKFNLKNRPISETDPMHIGDRFIKANEIEKWFDGFEKELREILELSRCSARAVIRIEEILGEASL